MEPAVVVMLDRVIFLGLTSRVTLKTRDFGEASNRAISLVPRLKRPHSRRNPWQPQAVVHTKLSVHSYKILQGLCAKVIGFVQQNVSAGQTIVECVVMVV